MSYLLRDSNYIIGLGVVETTTRDILIDINDAFGFLFTRLFLYVAGHFCDWRLVGRISLLIFNREGLQVDIYELRKTWC